MTQLVIHPAEQMPEAPSRSYAPIVTGVVVTVLALHMVVTRPLMKKIDSLNQQVISMQSELNSVAGSQADAWETNDLLTALTIQAERLDSADLALARFDGLASRLDGLNDRVVALSTVTDNAFAVVDDFDTLHDRLAAAAGESGAICQDLKDIEQVTDRLDELASFTPRHRDALDVLHMQSGEMTAIAARLEMETDTVEAADQTLAKLTTIASKLERTDTSRAATTTEGLINIVGRIDTEGTALLGPAGNVLADLRVATSGLETQGERLESLIESAEALHDFETEIAQHIRGLDQIRRELIEFAMLDSTIARVTRTLEPLTEFAKLRRLQPNDLRVVVDGLRENRIDGERTMISEKVEPERETLRTADRLVPEPIQILR